MNNNHIPIEYLCPITMDIMTDPVICDDGYTYERSAIQNIPNGISPITRQPINISNLITNRALKDSIKRFNTQYINENIITVDISNNELIFPSCENIIVDVVSPWNDKLYRITEKIKPQNWLDNRVKTTLVAVLDTSGSMGESCSLSAYGEQDGFSRLNLVQHSMNTVIGMLNPGDELVFSTI
jgi:hypothetical protein